MLQTKSNQRFSKDGSLTQKDKARKVCSRHITRSNHSRPSFCRRNLVVSTVISSEHITHRGGLLLLLFLLLFFLLLGSGISSASTSASSSAGAAGGGDELGNLLGVGKEVSENDGVEGLNLGVASGLEEGSDLAGGDLGLYRKSNEIWEERWGGYKVRYESHRD